MLLLWGIRYFDTRDKQFRDRDLVLETEALDPAIRMAVEATRELMEIDGDRKMLKYRHLFHEQKYSDAEFKDMVERHAKTDTFCIPDYFEDENGEELTSERMGQVLTGNPDAVMVPRGAKQHDIEFMFAPKPSVDLGDIQISEEDLKTLLYFSRDYRKMEASNCLIEGPGRIIIRSDADPVIQTSVPDKEIHSFVMVYRLLYMTGDRGNFLKAAEVFAKVVSPNPVGKWVKGVAEEYKQSLDSVPFPIPSVPEGGVTFTRKRLIDAFLYTQYAHQGQERRERQFAECLTQVNQKRGLLFWLFLRSIWECALHIRNAGIQIASFTEAYCRYHNLTSCAIAPASEYVGMGELETREDHKARVLEEKAEELAMDVWKRNGRPSGGPMQFIQDARKQLKTAMGMDCDKDRP